MSMFWSALIDVTSRVARCAIHGTIIVNQRCSTCDHEMSEP